MSFVYIIITNEQNNFFSIWYIHNYILYGWKNSWKIRFDRLMVGKLNCQIINATKFFDNAHGPDSKRGVTLVALLPN